MAESTIWGIHAGDLRDATSLFLDQNCIALGWPETGDLRGLPASRDAFKARYSEVYPRAKAGEVPVSAGQLFRFVHEMNPGDLVLFPAKAERMIHIGRVKGAYRFDATGYPDYPHRRPVEWLKALPRAAFTVSALQELGSALSIFQVRNFADEFRAALAGTSNDPGDIEDEGVAAVVEESQQSTEDFILSRLSRDFKGYALEPFVAGLLKAMGYRARVTAKSGDGGVDIIAHRDDLGFEPPIIKVQVKSSLAQISEPDVKQLKGALAVGEKGLLVTLGTFSPKAKAFAQTVPDIRLIDGRELAELIQQHYEKFDSALRAAIPLRRVYLPDSAR